MKIPNAFTLPFRDCDEIRYMEDKLRYLIPNIQSSITESEVPSTKGYDDLTFGLFYTGQKPEPEEIDRLITKTIDKIPDV
jgi:hypothetical protein